MQNPFKAIGSLLNNTMTAASIMSFEQAASGMTSSGVVGWNIGSNAHNLNFITSRQVTKSGSLMNGDAMLKVAACFDAVRMISEDIAKLPLDIKQPTATGGTRLVNQNHPLYFRIAISPDKQIRAKTFWESILAHALVWGNGYALIDRDKNNGIIRSLQLTHPKNVTAKTENGVIFYQVNNVDSKGNSIPNDTFNVLSEDMFHLHGIGDGVTGWPIVNYALESMGLTLSAETYQAAFIGNGGHLSGVLQTDAVIKEPEVRSQMVEQFTKKIGGVNNVGNVPLLINGLKYVPIDMKFTDAQLLETRQFQIEEVARWFRVPLHKLAILSSNATFNNIEQENLKYVNETLGPWITRLEDEIQFKLFADGSKFFAKFNTRVLTMGDAQSRANWNKEMFQMGSITPNEIRESEGLNPYDGGDQFYIPAQIGTPEEIQARSTPTESEEITPTAARITETRPTDPEEPDNVEDEQDDTTEQLLATGSDQDAFKYHAVIVDSLQPIIQREVKYQQNPKQDAAHFYDKQAQLLLEKVAVHLSYLDMELPKNYIGKWAENRSMLNWQDTKAEQMADDLLLHYYQAQNLPDGLYQIQGKQVVKEGIKLRYA
jgi:HK97 family phage portal protein